MTAFGVNIFSGMIPRTSARLIDDKFAQKAVNVNLTSGELRSMNGLLQIGSNLLTKTGTKKTIYKYGNDVDSESYYWFNFLDDKSIVRGNIANDTEERIYFTGTQNIVVNMWTNDADLMWSGDTNPMWNQTGFLTASMTYKSIALSGSDYPSNAYQLGVPRPATKPTLSVTNRFIASITRSGSVATATTEHPHTLRNNASIVLSGAAQTEYNGTFTVSVTGANTFTFPVTGTPITPATGTPQFNFGGLVQSIVYGVTYVTGVGEEGAPIVSELVNVIPGQEVTLSALPVSPSGNYNITKKRIYKTVGGSSSTAIRYVDEVAIAVTTYIDGIAADAIGEICPSLNWEVPPNELSGLIDIQNGMMAGISDNQVCFCFPYQPHAWPVAYRYSLNVKPIAIGAFGQSVVVLSGGIPSILSGVDPSQMTQDTIKQGQPCLSDKSVVEIAGGVAWASDEGIAFMSNQGFQLLTINHFTKKEWANYYPNTIRAYRYRNAYIGFYDSGSTKAGFVFDIDSKDFYEFDFYADSGFTDAKTGTLYLAVGNDVMKFDASSDALTFYWESKIFTMVKPKNFGYAKVMASDYPVTFSLYADKTLRHTKQVLNREAFRLPLGYLATDYTIVLSGKNAVTGVVVAEGIEELKAISE